MPELPAVETIKRGLETQIIKARVSEVTIGDSKILQCSEDQVYELVSQRILGLSRRGKYLIFRMSKNNLIIHLGMTGQLILRKPERPDSPGFLRDPVTGLQRVRQHVPDKHTHFQIYFEDGRTLLFRDTRKFGKVFLLPPNQDAPDRFLSKLGMEPLGKDYSLKPFLAFLGKRKAKIKSVLLDQSFIAGIGNIYADEALFEARIYPGKRVLYLTRKEKQRIFEAIPKVLEKGIHFGGTTLRDFVDSDGREGKHQEFLNVYGRKGQSCPNCSTEIEKTFISQRGTHFCPNCQRR